MAKIKYYVKENNKVGTHSYYAVPKPVGTLDFSEVCEEACENTSIEPSLMKAAVEEYMKAVKRNVLKGFRVALGDQFLFVYPNLLASVKDKKDAQGNVVKAVTIDDFTLAGSRSRLGASVSPKYSQLFAQSVSWQRVDASGNVVEDEDITDGGDTPAPGGGENTGGDNTGGGGTNSDGGDNNGGGGGGGEDGDAI